MRQWGFVLAAVLLVHTMHGSTARASTLKPLTFGERVSLAELIIRGRVMHVETVRVGTALRGESEAEKESVLPFAEPKRGLEQEEQRDPGESSSRSGEEALVGPSGGPQVGGQVDLTPQALGIEGGEMFYTRVRVQVDEELFGVAGRELTLNIPGGTDGTRSVIVHGMPTFEVGRQYFLFMRPSSAGGSDELVGANQGVFEIGQHASGAEYLMDATGDIVLGIETDQIVLRRNDVRKQGPARLRAPAPQADSAAEDMPAGQASAEVARYYESTELPMTVGAFRSAIASTKAVNQ